MILTILISLLLQTQSFSNCTVVLTGTSVVITCPVTPPPAPLAYNKTFTLPAAKVGVPYSANIEAFAKTQGGTKPYKYSALSGFPSWAKISTAGLLTGTPDKAGLLTMVIDIKDSSGVASVEEKGTTIVKAKHFTYSIDDLKRMLPQ